MTNWKEEFDKSFPGQLKYIFPNGMVDDPRIDITTFIQTEIIEAIINEIPEIFGHNRAILDLKQELRDKWLN